jgi:hypothetical protein
MYEKIKIESLRRTSGSVKRDSAIGVKQSTAGGMERVQIDTSPSR